MRIRVPILLLGLVVLVIIIGASAAGGAAMLYLALQQVAPAQAAPRDAVQPQADAEAGVLVAAVDLDGPAAQAGLVRGDIVLEVDGQTVNTPADLRRQLQDRQAGDTLTLTVRHGDDVRTLTATLAERDGRAYLGITPCAEMWAGAVFAVTAPLSGTLIIEVLPDTPAASAGLRPGDRIVAVEGQTLDAARTLSEAIGAYQPGEVVTLSVERPGEAAQDIEVTLGEHPDEAGRAYLGVRFAPFPAFAEIGSGRFPFDERPLFPHHFDVPDGLSQGIVIGAVAPDSPAAKAGLQSGDLITAVDGQAPAGFRTLAEAVAARQPGDMLTLSVQSTGADQPRELAITLAEDPDRPGQAYLGVTALGFFRVDGHPDRLPFDWPNLPAIPALPDPGRDI
jgi:S1-C subfamily serine protease